jgi:hypothetical protein
VHDAVGVDVEGDLDLRDAARRRRQVDELELAQRLVVHGHLALALEHVDLDRRLVVVGRGEDLDFLVGMVVLRSMSLVHDAALGLDAERQRGDVEQQDVLDLALEHAGLDGGADGHDLVGVDALVGSLPVSCLTRSWTAACGSSRRPAPRGRCRTSEPGVLDGLLERPGSARRGRR